MHNENPLESATTVIQHLKTDYGLDVTALRRLPLGADSNASVYKADAQNGSSYFIKLTRRDSLGGSIMIVDLLHKTGITQIIPPIKTIRGQTMQRVDEYALVVYPFITGSDGFSRTLTDAHWLNLGRALRQIHDTKVAPSIQKRIRREEYSNRWREAVRVLYDHLEAETFPDETALKFVEVMKEHRSVICRLANRAEQLGQGLKGQSPKFVLCHSDIHGGNVLLDGDEVLYIVDWDDPIMAPKERDLMFIGGGVANIWNKPHEEELFYSGYGKTEVNATILAYYRLERIVEDIAEFGQALLSPSGSREERETMYGHVLAMFEPSGVVDIAFKTDQRQSL